MQRNLKLLPDCSFNYLSIPWSNMSLFGQNCTRVYLRQAHYKRFRNFKWIYRRFHYDYSFGLLVLHQQLLEGNEIWINIARIFIMKQYIPVIAHMRTILENLRNLVKIIYKRNLEYIRNSKQWILYFYYYIYVIVHQ